MKIGRREVGEIVGGCVDKKIVKFFGVAEGRFPAPLRRASADRAQIFTHHVPFEVLCPPRLNFGGVMPPTPSFASSQYGLPYNIWQSIISIVVTQVTKSNFLTTSTSKKVFRSHCDNDRQPEIAIWPTKPEVLISLEL